HPRHGKEQAGAVLLAARGVQINDVRQHGQRQELEGSKAEPLDREHQREGHQLARLQEEHAQNTGAGYRHGDTEGIVLADATTEDQPEWNAQYSHAEIQQIHHADMGLDLDHVLHEEHRHGVTERLAGDDDQQNQHQTLEGTVVLHPQALLPVGLLYRARRRLAHHGHHQQHGDRQQYQQQPAHAGQDGAVAQAQLTVLADQPDHRLHEGAVGITGGVTFAHGLH